MPDEHGRNFNQYGQRYVGSVKRNSAAGTEGYWSTSTGQGPNWELIFALLYGAYKLLKLCYRAIARLVSSREIDGGLVSVSNRNRNFLESQKQASLTPDPVSATGFDAESFELKTKSNNKILDLASLLKLRHMSPLEIARDYGFLYSTANSSALLVDYLAFKNAVRDYTSKHQQVFIDNMQIYGPLFGTTIEQHNAGIKRLTGEALLSRLRSPDAKTMTKTQLAIASGYNFMGSDWREKIHFRCFYDEIIKAKSLRDKIPRVHSNITQDAGKSQSCFDPEDDLNQLLRLAENSVSRSNTFFGSENDAP